MKRRLTKHALVASAGLMMWWGLSFCAQAQTPVPAHADPAPAPAAEPATFRYTSQLTGTYTTGAVSRTLLVTTHALTYAKGRHVGLPVGVAFQFGRQEHRLRERELLLTASPYYRLRRFRAYGSGSYEQSNLRGIERRWQVGSGPGWALIHDDSLGRELLVSNLLLREETHFVDGTSRRVTRSSLRVKLAVGWRALHLASTTFYQPVLGNAADYRLSNASSLSLKLSTKLAFTTTYTYSFEQRVIEARARANTNLTVGLTLSNAN